MKLDPVSTSLTYNVITITFHSLLQSKITLTYTVSRTYIPCFEVNPPIYTMNLGKFDVTGTYLQLCFLNIVGGIKRIIYILTV